MGPGEIRAVCKADRACVGAGFGKFRREHAVTGVNPPESPAEGSLPPARLPARRPADETGYQPTRPGTRRTRDVTIRLAH